MFAGHFAAGLVLKRVEKRLNLGWLFFAAMFHDFLLGILVLLGLEQAHVPPDYAHLHYMTYTFPYSHGLVASLFWSLLAFGVAYLVLGRWTQRERSLAGLALGAAVFSHFVLDWIVHIPELPILGAGSPKIGLGLWNNLPVALGFEVGLLLLATIYYVYVIKPKTRLAKYGLGALMVILAALTVGGMALATTPPPVQGAAMTWIAQPLLISAIAFWMDRNG